MNSASANLRMPARLRRFAEDKRGVSAIEFAMLLPLMVTLYLGTVEISQGIAINRKVSITARTLADLAAQSQTLTNAQLQDLLKASSAVMTPYNDSDPTKPARLGVTVTSVNIDAQGKATVAWSQTLNNGPTHSQGDAVTLPAAALAVPNTSLVWSQAQYAYAPTFGYVLTQTINLHDQLYMRPRLSDSVTLTP
jgi:Flp pilus assembly protein TadG